MPELDADFEITTNNLETEYEISEGQHFDCSFEIFASGTTWGGISGNINNQTDLKEALDDKANVSAVEIIAEDVNTITNTLDSYGDIVTYDAADFATKNQGELADTALQPNDNITELNNNANFVNETQLTNGLAEKQDTISDLSTIRSNAENGQSAYSTIQNYGNIVTHNVNEFATSAQGALADSALQPNDNITELNNDAGYITGINSEDVTDALGYTPYNSTNPNGYQENVIESIEVNGTAQTISNKTVDITVPTDTSDLTNGAGYITSASLPTVNDSTITFQKNGSTVESITLNQSNNETINFSIPTTASDINAVPTSRTINGKALTSNISLDSTDVGALSDTTTINDLTTTTQQNALDSGANTTNIGQIATNTSDITTIEGKIPTQASTSNQLADKNFVNSSIATNTANFIGTFQSVADLEAYSGTLTNNDYAFVETTDTAGNTLYDRYKYTTATTPASWVFEYELNNSSFTSNQWASINSGITSNDVTLIGTALQPNDNVSSLTNDAGYITSSSLPTVNNGTLTIQQNGTDVQTFTANQSSNVTANITVPTDTGDLTNNAGYITGITSSDVTNALGYTPYDNTNPDGFISGITSSDVTTALGYTPYNSSNPNGYTNNVGTVTSVNNTNPDSNGNVSITIPTVPTNISAFNNDSGYITGITSTDVTTALGYTPYSSANPSGYTSNVGTVTSVNNNAPDANGNVTISTGSSTDVQINGASITSQGVANIVTNTAYNASSNKIATMSDLPDNEIFVAEYGTTTFSQITTAITSGKKVFLRYQTTSTEYYATLSYASGSGYYFLSGNTATIRFFAVSSSSIWNYSDYGLGNYRFDGQWVFKYSSVATNTAINSYSHSLSSYLPSDTYSYEVFVKAQATTLSSSSGGSCNFVVGTSASPATNSDTCYNLFLKVTTNSTQARGVVILPVGTGRTIYSQISSHKLDSSSIELCGYRRIGTNS